MDTNETEKKPDISGEDPEEIKRKMEELKANRNKLFTEGQAGVTTQTNLDSTDLSDPVAMNKIMQDGVEQRKEVSALTVGRMLGLVTISEFKLMENKLDLLTGKLNNTMLKLDKVSASLSQIPTGSDLERIDVQIGALRTMIKDTLVELQAKPKVETSSEKLASTKIVTND